MNRFYTEDEYRNSLYNSYMGNSTACNSCGTNNDTEIKGYGVSNTNTSGNNSTNSGNHSECSFTNTATANGYLEAMGSGTPTMVSGEDSVTLNCIFADIIKTADKETVSAGDRVKYTITFRNMSDREMYNVKITDSYSQFLSPIATTISPAPRPGESLKTGITIGRVPANSERTLTYTAVVANDVHEDVVNRAFADFTFRTATSTEQTASTHITTLTLPMENQGITVKKTADKSYITTNGETVVFTITVHNDSARTLHDLVISDKLPKGMHYLENSTIIGNQSAIDADPADGIYVGTLKAGGTATVKFSATVHAEQ